MIKSKFANLFSSLYRSGRWFFFQSSFKVTRVTISVLTCAIFELMQWKEWQLKISAPVLPVMLHILLWSQPNLADLSSKTRTEPIQLHEKFSLLNLIKEEARKSNLWRSVWINNDTKYSVESPFLSNTLSTAKSIKYFIFLLYWGKCFVTSEFLLRNHVPIYRVPTYLCFCNWTFLQSSLPSNFFPSISVNLLQKCSLALPALLSVFERGLFSLLLSCLLSKPCLQRCRMKRTQL